MMVLLCHIWYICTSQDISLGVADTYKLWAVFDSEDASSDIVLPQFTFTGLSGVFTKGEVIVGGTSGARAIAITGPMFFVILSKIIKNSLQAKL